MKKNLPHTTPVADSDRKAAIAYQNKDIVSKLFGERMKGKPLSLFGLDSNLNVADIRPTNIPIVRAKELRMDNLFELEDGSLAILDYESDFKETNFTKYGRYLMDVIDRYLKEGKQPDIHMMVLYTADIEPEKTSLERTACCIRVEAACLTGISSEKWLEEIQTAITHHCISDTILMHLILLPLTYKDNGKKQEIIKQCINFARKIPDKEQETFALAGLLAFTDKIIDEATKQYIMEVLSMTQIEQILTDRARQEGLKEGKIIGRKKGEKKGVKKGDYARAKKTALKMLKKGTPLTDIAEILEFPEDTIKSWEKESFDSSDADKTK